MEQYIKDKHIINATQKAYETIYKDRGYVSYKEEKKNTKKKEEADK